LPRRGENIKRLIRPQMFILRLWVCCLGLTFSFLAGTFAEDSFRAGPIFDQFALVLDPGDRVEAIGPFFYDQHKDSEKTWATPPLLSYEADPATESSEFDLLYPLMTDERYGSEYRWQLAQLLSFAGGREQDDSTVNRFTLFPFIFLQRSSNPDENYTALFPLGGRLRNRLFRDEIVFAAFPVYGQSRKRDIVTDNYFYPFFHLRHGNGLAGWQFWPLVGNEHKDTATRTNGFGETEIIGGHDRFFALWPVYFHQNNDIGTDNPEKFRAVIPFYAWSRSPRRDATSVLWPFFNWIDDREKKYHEWEGPWPFIAVARGEGKTTTRFWPLFSRSHNDVFESNFYLWPLYKYKHLQGGDLDRERTRILFYLFSDVKEKNTATGAVRSRVDLWPLFVWRQEFNGCRRLQILALVETALPNNRGVERNWSPLWSVWRSENNPQAGASSQSLLWNLYRWDTAPASKKCSLLFGLFQYQSDSKMKKVRLFYIPVLQRPVPAERATK
jgi:hypothetical protein